MPKISFTTLVAVVLIGVVGYLAYNPAPAQDAIDWLRRQAGVGNELPDSRSIGHPSYTPMVPAK